MPVGLSSPIITKANAPISSLPLPMIWICQCALSVWAKAPMTWMTLMPKTLCGHCLKGNEIDRQLTMSKNRAGAGACTLRYRVSHIDSNAKTGILDLASPCMRIGYANKTSTASAWRHAFWICNDSTRSSTPKPSTKRN